MADAFICDYVRTPIGRFGGALSSVRADDLAAVPLRALKERNGSVDWDVIEEVYYGCANQAGEDNRNVARMASLLAEGVTASDLLRIRRIANAYRKGKVSQEHYRMLQDLMPMVEQVYIFKSS